MEARIKPLIVAVVCVIIAASAALAQQGSPAGAAGTPNDVNTAVTVSFPYVARMTGNNVYVRSGPGTNYYACGKLSKGDKITVVGSHFGWLRIVPPAGQKSSDNGAKTASATQKNRKKP